MKKFLGISATLLLAVFMAQTAGAAIIEYDATFLGGDRWQYDYTINNEYDFAIDLFDIYFEDNLYGNMELLQYPNDWDTYLFNPAFAGDTWLLTAMVLGDLLLPGESTSIFSVVFDWLGEDARLGGQDFAVYNTDVGGWEQSMGSGITSGGTEPIPEPQTFLLLGTGILGLVAYYRTRKGKR